MSKELLSAAKSGRQRWRSYLENEKEEERSKRRNEKHKLAEEEVQTLRKHDILFGIGYSLYDPDLTKKEKD